MYEQAVSQVLAVQKPALPADIHVRWAWYSGRNSTDLGDAVAQRSNL